jgi:aspartyl-tRNA(Asn)/glutamyl-tRNA(Gln) amidotransferase subunit B
MEEDAGKLLHGDNLQTKEGSLVDLNRAGVPLIEIVGEPDLRTPAEAAIYLRKLRSILRYIDVCDGNMEEGSLRCDANVSIRKRGESALGTKVEIKNMNSFKHVAKAIEYEIQRQEKELDAGSRIHQETRLWNPDKGITTSMRSKEEAHDYRYFPEPDLLPLEIERKWLNDLRNHLPELPDERKARLEKELGLSSYDAGVLTAEKEIADYFEQTLEAYASGAADKAKTVANYVTSEVMRIANDRKETLEKIKITPTRLAEVLAMVENGKISGKMAKEVLDEMAATGKSPTDITNEKGLSQISDSETIRKMIQKVIADHPGQTSEYRSGKEKLFGFFVGQVMKVAQGKANPSLVNEILKEELTRGV